MATTVLKNPIMSLSADSRQHAITVVSSRIKTMVIPKITSK